jgi:very-short-patch-repair endonuclease
MLRPEVIRARKQRRAMTYPEVLLWQRLRKKAAGVRFRNQHPVGPYVVDFYCSTHRLAVEVDGEIHATPAQLRADTIRDRFLKENGYQVLRVRAAEILKDADGVAASVAAVVALPLHHASHGPPPRSGEDQGRF